MIKFLGVKFNVIPNKAHFNFFDLFNSAIKNASEAIKTAVGTLAVDLDTLFIEEKNCATWVKKSDLTIKIEEADKKLDNSYTELRKIINSFIYSSNEQVRSAAVHTYDMLESYGNVNSKSYNQQAGCLKAIIINISAGGSCANDIMILSVPAPAIGTIIIEIKANLSNFENLLNQRDIKKKEKPPRPFKKVRRDIDIVYHKITEKINSSADTETDPSFVELIMLFNEKIDAINKSYQRTRYDIADSEPEQIPEQYFTGEKVTPNTKVYYKTEHKGTVLLAIGTDYDVRYRKNKNVGIATLIIHGIGGYKGKKSITFAIKRRTSDVDPEPKVIEEKSAAEE
ncbi:MAG: DUF6261 family protein [Dysgonamonadaceae bacterium]|jgi:hypothetical protein|nr:DUF6261 family protein [Dysgonamonadaceae bacterium]